MSLHVCGSIHQGHERFSIHSRGKQCSFMSLSAILTAQSIPDLLDWNSTIIDNALEQGDNMYLIALRNGQIPRVGYLSVDNLPNYIQCSSFVTNKHLTLYTIDLPTVARPIFEAQNIITQNTTDLPIVVEPIEAQNVIDLPIVVEPIEAQNVTDLPIAVEPIEAQNVIDPPVAVEPIEAQNVTDLPIVVEPIEAQNVIDNIEAQNVIDPPIVVVPVAAQSIIDPPIVMEPIKAKNIVDSTIKEKNNTTFSDTQLWFINYGKDYQGLVRNEQGLEHHYFTLASALLKTFMHDKYALLILEGYMMALINSVDSFFYLFDPHARNYAGMPDPNGTAVVMKFASLTELEKYLCLLSTELNTNLFEIVPVQFYVTCKKQSGETQSMKQTRLQIVREYKKRKQGVETETEKQTRLENARMSKKRKRGSEENESKKKRLENAKSYKKLKRAKVSCADEQARENLNQQDYLKIFDKKNGGIEEQCWAKANMNKFHKSVQYTVYQCTECKEAWPLKSKPKSPYVCSRCLRDKKFPKKFSCENSMIPSCVPNELKDLTQVEEMLIARALPIMRVYIKPGGQRGYSGHCINLPQNVTELATSLPRYPKDLAVIIVKVKGKDNTFKDVRCENKKCTML